MVERKPALGKGLSALIPDAPDTLTTARASLDVDVDLLEPNDYQPRGQMEDERLEELAQSIKANGIIQPIVARRLESGRYQIIAGERRWRAAQRAGLTKVPVVVKDVGGDEKQRRLEMA
jgi:ParB family chromosome partitioning protein